MPKAFFVTADVSQKTKKPTKRNLSKTYTCDDCGLYKTCYSPRMKYTGLGRKKILIIGEAPGRNEDEQGKQFIGQAGQPLRDVFKKFGIIVDRDCWVTNTVKCRPIKNATPTNIQIQACRPLLLHEIKRLQPKLIFLIGDVAFESIIGHKLIGRADVKGFEPWTFCYIPDQEYKAWLCPIYHPAYMLRRKEWDKAFENIWEKNIEEALKYLDKPIIDYLIEPETTKDKGTAIKMIKDAIHWENSAFDYETTGLLPFRTGQKIVTASISNKKKTYAFPFFEDDEFIHTWKKYLTTKHCKIAHNISFENIWSKHICGQEIQKPIADTIINAHVWKNNKPVNLKFLVYIFFGVLGYDSEIEEYLKSTPKEKAIYGSNAFNRILQVPIQDILFYNGLDSYFESLLYDAIPIVSQHLYDGIDLFTRGTYCLSEIQYTGVSMDKAKIEKNDKELLERIDTYKKEIFDSQVLKEWQSTKEFNPDSADDLKKLFFNILKMEPTKTTAKGNPSVDKEVLSKIDLPIARSILNYRKWYKARNTYLAQFKREEYNGFIHPSCSLAIPISYRSSVSNPSFQNLPARDKEVMNYIRSTIIPRKGNKLIGYDYKGIEVAMAGVYTQDTNLIAYLNDKTKDMHRDQASEICLIPVEEVTRLDSEGHKIRYLAKNKFVFPEFYGSYYEDIAPDLWSSLPNIIKKHLYKNYNINERNFVMHIKDVEYVFWNKLFYEYKQWKEDQYEQFIRDGYVDSMTGFRYYGPMKRNEVLNYAFQGSAFHCLLKTLIGIQENEIHKLKNTFIVGQIHDELIFDVCPEEEEKLDDLIYMYGIKKVKEDWPWINVPLDIEKNQTPIGGDWSRAEDCGFIGVK